MCVCVCVCVCVTVDVYNQGICIFPENFSEYVYYLIGPANIQIHWNVQGIYILIEKIQHFYTHSLKSYIFY